MIIYRKIMGYDSLIKCKPLIFKAIFIKKLTYIVQILGEFWELTADYYTPTIKTRYFRWVKYSLTWLIIRTFISQWSCSCLVKFTVLSVLEYRFFFIIITLCSSYKHLLFVFFKIMVSIRANEDSFCVLFVLLFIQFNIDLAIVYYSHQRTQHW